ncbi:MAG: acyltransferase [Vicingaceae bacterium]|nr:acyltransferase [Vicingaceae bacterium]
MYLEATLKNIIYRCKGRWLKIYLLLHGCKVGKKLKCLQFPTFRAIPKKNITIGNNVTIGKNVAFEIDNEGKLIFEDNVLIADNILLSTLTSIRLGKWSAIAENVSIRGSFHEMKKDQPYRLQGNISEPIIIEEDTGIGAGCVVLMGVTIPKGAFIGSNSLVTKNDELEEYGIYGGNPLKLLKKRT